MKNQSKRSQQICPAPVLKPDCWSCLDCSTPLAHVQLATPKYCNIDTPLECARAFSSGFGAFQSPFSFHTGADARLLPEHKGRSQWPEVLIQAQTR